MGKVISFKDHYIKDLEMTVETRDRVRKYVKWMASYHQKMVTHSRATFEKRKRLQESPE